jgi:CDP-diacylglycerol---serine O-phosphatidyltransferase
MPPLKYFVPNSFTAASLVLGLASAVCSVKGRFDLAAWMILWGTLLDKADGTAARLCKATSGFGVEFDSFADFVSFGVAPAALIYFRLEAHTAHVDWLAAAAGLYVLALAIRLSRFNITTGAESVFYGIPGTMVGAVIAAGYLTASKYHVPEAAIAYAPALLVLGAIAMISTVRLPKLKARKSRAMNVFTFTNVAVAYVCGPLMLFPEYLLGLAVTYLVGGVVWCLANPEPAVRAVPAAKDADSERLAA